jgi:hypothetical protein
MSVAVTLHNYGQIGRIISQDSQDYSDFDRDKTHQRIKEDVEAAVIVTTLQSTIGQEVEKIRREKEPYIQERNAILGNSIKYFFYKKRLAEIEAKLDELDMLIYLLETRNTIKQSTLDEIIATSKARLDKYQKYLDCK